MTGPDVSKIELKEGERIDDLERNHLGIIQDPNRFCFGMDAVLLSGFAAGNPAQEKEGAAEIDKEAGSGKRRRPYRKSIWTGASVLDLGTGTGIIPILLSAKTDAAHITGLEIQEASADMARRSVRMDGLEERIDIKTGDIREADSLFEAASFDAVTCNPPYIIAQHGIADPDDPKAVARHEILCSFDDVARVTARLLKSGGHFFLVHRPFRMAEIFVTLHAYGLEPKRLRLVYPFADREPNMFLLDCVRGGKSRLTVERPLVVYKAPGQYCDEIYDIYGY